MFAEAAHPLVFGQREHVRAVRLHVDEFEDRDVTARPGDAGDLRYRPLLGLVVEVEEDGDGVDEIEAAVWKGEPRGGCHSEGSVGALVSLRRP